MGAGRFSGVPPVKELETLPVNLERFETRAEWLAARDTYGIGSSDVPAAGGGADRTMPERGAKLMPGLAHANSCKMLENQRNYRNGVGGATLATTILCSGGED